MMTCSVLLLAAVAAADVTAGRFPDADAVLVEDFTKIAYRPDGTFVETCESRTKVLTEKGRREERTIRLDYSKRYGEASVDSVVVVGTNGVSRRIDVAANSKEATNNGLMAENIYDPLDRQIVCQIPDLEVGETVCVKTTRRGLKPRCRDQWSDIELFESTCPLLNARVEIVAPKERPLKRIAIRHPLGNVAESRRTLANGDVLHVFTATNSPQAFPEPDMPPLYTQVQNLRVSTAADWPEISRWYWDLCAPHLAKTNAAMVAKAKELGSIRAIFKFVSQEVRYMGLTLEDTSPGYAPHDVDITFDSRYGVCRDKAGLLVAMLRLAGFDAFPVLINVGAKLDPEVPQPYFNHAIVAVDRGGKDYVLMDPTNENAKDLLPSYENDQSYLVCRPEGDGLRVVPVRPPEENALVVQGTGSLAKDGSLLLEHEVSFVGINDTAYRGALARRTPEDRVDFFERVVRGLAPGAELLSCVVEPSDMRDTEKPVRVRLTSRLPGALLRGETTSRLNVPFLSKTLGIANFLLMGNNSLEKRRFPLVLNTTAKVAETVEIDLGGNVGEVLELPKGESPTTRRLANPVLGYSRSFAVSNGVLKAGREMSVAKVEVSPEGYLRVREDLKRIEAAERPACVFAIDPLSDADVRLIERSVEVDVRSDTAWTVTNRVVKEVLTYQGKRSSAELSFPYAPCVEAFEVVSAVVSNRDGRVRAVAPREMNVMDCGWAARAPRYPASKTLVVNLPGVEIGSVVSYVTVRTVTNAPAAYYSTFCFDGYDPCDRLSVRVNDWSREVRNLKRLPDEPAQPDAAFWRDEEVVSFGRFEKVDLKIPAVPEPVLRRFPEGTPLRTIRDWMAKHVKIAGPSLYEIPLERQLTDPETVLKDGYATRLDYMRALCLLLRGAGYEADVVFAASNADAPVVLRARDMFTKPNVRAFGSPLCRVRRRSGGFFGWGETVTETFVGTESEYAPVGPTAFAGSDYFDPGTGEFGAVTVPDPGFHDAWAEASEYAVRANGDVDVTVTTRLWGSRVGAFRKRYAEILPEERERAYQAIVGAVAQAATATSELETDTSSYPALRRFSCFVPGFATVEGDAITLTLPELCSSIPSYTGRARQTPFAIGAVDRETEEVTVRFPKGYTAVEHLPESFAFANPNAPDWTWLECRVSSRVEKDGTLTVTIRREVSPHGRTWFPAPAFELVRDWRRRASSRASRTIVVRRDASVPARAGSRLDR